MNGDHFLVLNPAGPVARIELHLIVVSIILVLIVVIPVAILLAYITRRYRDHPDNKAPYMPEWSESKVLEIIWWGIPVTIIAILGVYTAYDTFALVKPPEKNATPVTIQVTSLNWKWLFQYPEQGIATVNECDIPVNRPVQFVITANSPMNGFWVPQLGGQEYAMPGMAMRLWLQADHPGIFYGHGGNFTGRGYAKMDFHVVSRPSAQFAQWVQTVKKTAPALTSKGYNQLVSSQNNTPTLFYSSYPAGSFERTIRHQGGMYMQRDLTIIGASK
ncbi:MAG: cytochrome ubiquinol oxidase subunit II [Firmicutes bacterium]|nr:cytochrome ubiquinol oxidase subunit II [Bacillota bacterium]